MANTIQLKGAGLRKEAPAGAAITPGHLIVRNASGQFVVHPTAGGATVAMFAIENELFGKEITEPYAIGEQVLAWVPEKGGEVYALVPAAAAAIVIGDSLQSNGDGTFVKAGAGVVLAKALTAVDNSAGGAVARIQVEVL